jgi:hypothetical protein
MFPLFLMGKIRLVYVLFGISPWIWNGLRTYTEVPLYIRFFYSDTVQMDCGSEGHLCNTILSPSKSNKNRISKAPSTLTWGQKPLLERYLVCISNGLPAVIIPPSLSSP